METIVQIAESPINIEITPSINPTELTFTDVGVQGMRGTQGLDGKSLLFNWDNTRLGVKVEDEISYTYTELKGDKLLYSDLTPSDKTDLLQDVGNTTTNYVNIFYANLV